jgi:ferredoxin-NADP reductase
MKILKNKFFRWFSESLTQKETFLEYFHPVIQTFFNSWEINQNRAEVVYIKDEVIGIYTIGLKVKRGIMDSDWPSFKPGQYIELNVEKEGRKFLRCFSISSSPRYYIESGIIELSIRIQKSGAITGWMKNNLKIKKIVNISKPKGGFILPIDLDKDPQQKLLFIAGGSGITPFRSMIYHLNKSFISVDVNVLYYSGDIKKILFEEELSILKNNNKGINIEFIDSKRDGRICKEHIIKKCGDYDDRNIFICGPSNMIEQTRKLLNNELNIEENKIQFELFGAEKIEINNNQNSEVLFKNSDKKSLSKNGEITTLLNQAELLGINPLSGCRMGVCNQCVCIKRSGVVFNTLTKEYSDTGEEKVKMCISIAQGSVVLDI